ncbi:MAG: hydroxymethylglutaryl-CoA synthase [Bacillota bacterium]
MTVGIVDCGVYIPKYRITRKAIGENWGSGGKGEIGVAGPDEDVVTMSVETGQDLLKGMDPRGVQALFIGSASFPYMDHSSSGIVRESLGLNNRTEIADYTGSVRASLAALKACVNGIEAGKFDMGMVIGSDARRAGPGSEGEKEFGAGAAGLLLKKIDHKDAIIAEIEECSSFSTNFPESWSNPEDGYVWDYEPRFIRKFGFEDHVVKAVNDYLSERETSVSSYDYFAFQGPNSRDPLTVAKRLGIALDKVYTSVLVEAVGDIGNASVLMGLAYIFEKALPGQRILIASFGSGTVDVISIKVGPGVDKAREKALTSKYLQSKQNLTYIQYLKYREVLVETGVEPALGVPAMSPLVWRDSEALHHLEGNKCIACGYINYPPSQKLMCIRCGGTNLERVALAKKGTLHTYAINYYLPKPLASPLPILFVDLDDGTRMRVLGTELATELKIGMTIEMVFRRIATDRGFNLYGYKGRGERL